MLDIYFNCRISKEDDLFFLKQYKDYEKSLEKEIHFEYCYEHISKLNDYFPKNYFIYDFNNDFNMMIKMMIWVHKILIPHKEGTPVQPFNCINILEKTKKEALHSNCWMFAVVLNEIFLNFGIKSRMIRCMPFDLRFNDCHCVVQAYSNKYKKWVLFDPAFGTYYTDINKTPINLKEFRSAIINNEKVLVPFVPAKKSKVLINYWIKNLFRFETYSISKFNIESLDDDVIIYSLLPIGYELTDKEIKINNHSMRIVHTHNEIDFWEG